MLRFFQRCGWAMLLVMLANSSQAFSLHGPATGGDSWQTPNIGYVLALPSGCPGGPGGYIGAPKNIGEGYRWNVSTLYYAYDQNFLDYFGSNGVASIDKAFLILSNHLSAARLSKYSASLNEFPLQVNRVNYRAQALQAIDLGSYTLSLMTLDLGLVDSENWTWTLRRRFLPGGASCPAYIYDVIQRNFDPVTYMPSKYVNGVLFTYVIDELCPTCDYADAVEVSVDPFAPTTTAVTAGISQFGQIFTGLTRDDMGGFRYLYATNSIHAIRVESVDADSTVVSGGFTNVNVTTLITTVDLATFVSQSLTNAPGAMQSLYPNLEIVTSSNVIFSTVVTNLTLTNSSTKAGSSQIITNVSNTQLLYTLDLAVFGAAADISDPLTMSNLYPGLVITSAVPYFRYAYTTNITATNYYPPNAPYGTVAAGFSTNITLSLTTNYTYGFANVVTNLYSTNSYLTAQQLTFFATTPWSAYGTFSGTAVPATTKLVTNVYSGDFYIVPPNLCGYNVLSTILTNVIATTNFGNFVISGLNVYQQNLVTYFTNHALVVQPINCYTAISNFSSILVTNFQYTYDNVLTNSSYSSNYVTTLVTNLNTGAVTSTSRWDTTAVSGSIFILPTNQCGLSIISTQLVLTTTVTSQPSIYYTNSVGVGFSTNYVTYQTNYTVAIHPVDCNSPLSQSNNAVLRMGIDRMYFVRHDYDSLIGQFFGRVTNTYTSVAVYSNQPVVQTLRRIIRRPDILFSATDQLLGGATITTNIFNTGNILTGLAGPGTLENQYKVTFNKVGPLLENNGPYFIDEATALTNYIWGSFDATTNAPVIFPNGTSLVQIENQILMQITNSSTLPNGVVNSLYPTQTLGGTGGTPPYTWSYAAGSGSLPAGLSLIAGQILGTPAANTQATYDVTILMTDATGRSIAKDFSITITN